MIFLEAFSCDKNNPKTYKYLIPEGIAEYVVKETTFITGISAMDAFNKINYTHKNNNTHAILSRQSSFQGKYYTDSYACAPRERIEINGDDTLIMVEIIAPYWLHNECLFLEELKYSIKPAWKVLGFPAGKKWMIDVIWANLSVKEREKVKQLYNIEEHDESLTKEQFMAKTFVQLWLYKQLIFNFGKCFTDNSKLFADMQAPYQNMYVLPTFNGDYEWMLTERK